MVSVPPSLPLCLKAGYTALMMASHNGHTATVELLLGAGADTEAKNKVRETKRAIYTHTCGYQNGLKEVAPCLREHLYMCSTNSSHTHVFATYLTTLRLLISIVFSSFSLSLLLWCVPPSPSVVRVATLLS